MTTMLEATKFITFLKEQKALTAFTEELQEKRDLLTIKDWKKESVRDEEPPRKFLSNAFIWEGTSQGHDYWSALNESWWEAMPEVTPTPGYKATTDFITFLKKHRLCRAFMRGINHTRAKNNLLPISIRGWKSQTIEGNLLDEAEAFLVCSFIWGNTKEGHDTWDSLNKHWQEHLQANNQ